MVICCLAINVILNLTPRTGCVFVNAYVTRDRCSAIIAIAPIATRSPVEFIETELARCVICCFAINVRPSCDQEPLRSIDRCARDLRYLHCHHCYTMHRSRPGHRPSSSRQKIQSRHCCLAINVTPSCDQEPEPYSIDAHVTRVGCSAIITICSDRDPVTGRVHRDRTSREVTCCFAINVTTKLRPRTGGVLIDAHVTRVGCGAIIANSSDRDPVTGRVHRDGLARASFAASPSMSASKLRPRTGGVFVDAYVTRVGCSAVILICSDRDPVTG